MLAVHAGMVLQTLALASGAVAESALRLVPPDEVSLVDVATYDEAAEKRLGGGVFGWQRTEDGQYRFLATSRIEGGARTQGSALLAPTPDGGLEPLRQESRSHDAKGELLGVLTIDHEAQRATCDRRGEKPFSVGLPEKDRVANVIFGLAVRSLVRSGDEPSRLALVVCRFGGHVVAATARIRESERWRGRDLVTLRLAPDLGPILGGLLGPLLPRLPMWFERDGADWLGHRMPLHPEAPTVTVLRADIAPSLARHVSP